MARRPRLRRADAVAGAEADPLLGTSPAGRQALADQQARRPRAGGAQPGADGPRRRQALPRARLSPTPSARLDRPGTPPTRRRWPAPPLTDEQQAAVAGLSGGFGRFQPFPALRRHRQRQDGGLPAPRAAGHRRRWPGPILVPEIALTPQLEGRVAYSPARVVACTRRWPRAPAPRASCGPWRAAPTSCSAPACRCSRPAAARLIVVTEHDASRAAGACATRPATSPSGQPARAGRAAATPSLETCTPRRPAATRARTGRAVRRPAQVRPVDAPPKAPERLSEHLLRAIDAAPGRAAEPHLPETVAATPRCCAVLRLGQPLPALHRQHGAAPGRPAPALPPLQLRGRHPLAARPTAATRTSSPSAAAPSASKDPRRTLSHRPRAARRQGRRAHPRQWDALLEQIGSGEADILVGTDDGQGPRLPCSPSSACSTPIHPCFAADFRAPERLFQQLMQVGGRAGRALPAR